MTPHDIAWICAFELSNTFADRLTPEQHIACQVAAMRHPDRAPLVLIALACQIMGRRT
jgi:hypothetical protein